MQDAWEVDVCMVVTSYLGRLHMGVFLWRVGIHHSIEFLGFRACSKVASRLVLLD